MNISALFIKRPIATTLVMLGVLVFGTMSYQRLPISDLPQVDFPTINVNAGLPGANPETMAASVALPLEKVFSTIAGLKSINSNSSQGSTSITLQFDLDRDIDAAAQDVQSMIARAQGQLPDDMPSPPSYRKINPNDQSILVLALRSPTLPISTVHEYAENTVAPRISTVPGVAQVVLIGPAKHAVRVDLDPNKLAAYGIGIDEVSSAIRSANVNLPTGTVYGAQRVYSIIADGQLLRAPAYASTVMAYRNGSPVRLDQVAHVYDGLENERGGVWLNRNRAISLGIQKQPGTNVVQIVDRIMELLPTFQEQLPPTVLLEVRANRSVFIRESVADVKFTLILTIALVVMVIFLFLRNLSATVIPSLALPVSIVGTFAVMYLLGYSLDNLSLMALTLSVGFVVDDAIVMLENIVRHMEMGKSAMQAAYDGSKEIVFTIVSMTISLVAVFIPMLFMSGIVGRLLREFAVTIGVAILVSGFVSLTLTPMLCSRFLRPARTKHNFLYNLTERMFDAWLRLYDRTLRMSLRFRFVSIVVSIAMVWGTVEMFKTIPKDFLPREDTGRLNMSTEMAQGTTYDEFFKRQWEIAEIVNDDPNMAAVNNQLGNSTNRAGLFTDMKPRDQRKPIDEVIAGLRPKLAEVPGIRVFMTNPPLINLGGQIGARSQYQFTMQHTDIAELYHWAGIFLDKVPDLPGLDDVSHDLELTNPQIRINMDRERIAALGLTVNQVESALSNAYGERNVSTIYAANNQYEVIMRLAPEHQKDPNSLSLLHIRAPNGRLIPLNTLATVRTDAGAQSVPHTGQLPSVTLTFNLQPGTALGDAVDSIRELAAQTLPSTVVTSFQGAAQAFEEAQQGLGLILLLAIVVIYIVLGILYESFTHPITILSALPAAGFGALIALIWFETDLSLYAFVGIIMLVGLVKKNGIMMVDFAVAAQRERGLSPVEAIREASLVRFRPIMMTTMTALAGTLPIALGVGAGAESRRPLGIAVVGGLFVSQLLTLYITPVYYAYIEEARIWLAGRRRSKSPSAEAAAHATLAEEKVGLHPSV